MKIKKYIISIIVILAMLIGTVVTAYAETTPWGYTNGEINNKEYKEYISKS